MSYEVTAETDDGQTHTVTVDAPHMKKAQEAVTGTVTRVVEVPV